MRQHIVRNEFNIEKENKVIYYFLVQNEQQTPTNVCDIFDIYTNNGENRLTFLCQIRPTRERRSKSIKYSIVAQLISKFFSFLLFFLL